MPGREAKAVATQPPQHEGRPKPAEDDSEAQRTMPVPQLAKPNEHPGKIEPTVMARFDGNEAIARIMRPSLSLVTFPTA
jgi:hypothetical protein